MIDFINFRCWEVLRDSDVQHALIFEKLFNRKNAVHRGNCNSNRCSLELCFYATNTRQRVIVKKVDGLVVLGSEAVLIVFRGK